MIACLAILFIAALCFGFGIFRQASALVIVAFVILFVGVALVILVERIAKDPEGAFFVMSLTAVICGLIFIVGRYSFLKYDPPPKPEKSVRDEQIKETYE